MRLSFLLGGLLLAALPYHAAAQSQPTMHELMATPVKVRGVDCALFPAIAQLDTLYLHVAQTEPRRFTPSAQQVEAAEKQLQTVGIRAIRSPLDRYEAANLAHIQKHLRQYKRQYFGFYNEQHQACFFIQFFENAIPNWLTGQLFISDGGTSAWEMHYNLTTQHFYALHYHSF